MVNATINGKNISVDDGTYIIGAISKAGFKVPTLCAWKGINDIGVCRVCVVEVEGTERLVTACNTVLQDGMNILTDTPRVLEARRTNVQLLLSQHDVKCPTCVRNGNCVLQSVSQELNVLDVPYDEQITYEEWEKDFPLIRDSSKCVRCMRCIQVCDKVVHAYVWDVKNRATHTDVGVRDGLTMDEAGCTLCGQCITHCPVGALTARDDTGAIIEALADPDAVVVASVAPSVRTSWAEAFGMSQEEATEGKLVSALRAVGFDYVFDTNFAADMTIMEEGTEFLKRFSGEVESAMPMFTSCCPGWVRFVKLHHPKYLPNLSSAKSPQQMFGPLLKEYVAPKLGMVAPKEGSHYLKGVAEGAGLGIGVDTNPIGGGNLDEALVAAAAEGATTSGDVSSLENKRVFHVSFMPCVAKKYEAAVQELARTEDPDVDAVLTIRELSRLLKMMHVNPKDLADDKFDSPMSEGAGAAVIFGSTGGVMEAALRSAYALAMGENPDPDAFKDVRAEKGWIEKTFMLGDTPVRTAVVSGLGNADELLKALDAGEVEYDFVEVMACPGGCVGGGGQPIHEGRERAADRKGMLYDLDKSRATRFSHENPEVKACYEEFLGEPNSHLAHELLHTDQSKWTV